VAGVGEQGQAAGPEAGTDLDHHGDESEYEGDPYAFFRGVGLDRGWQTSCIMIRPGFMTKRIALVVALLAGGVAIVTGGRAAGALGLAAAGGTLVVAGLVGLLAAAFGPLRRSVATRRPLIWAAYVVAIVEVAIGVSLASADLAGDSAVTASWPLLKPAHAWLNVLGFVSLVIATTLVHFLPTIAGTRIVRRRPLDVALVALAAGPAVVAAGMAVQRLHQVRAGAVVEAVGAVGLVVGAAGIVRARGRWTTDPGWHRFTLGSLLAGLGWFVVGTAGAVGPAVAHGASTAAWDLRLVLGPLAIGWTAQAIVGSAAHLLPSIGPGDPAAHRAMRSALARSWAARVVGLNLGAALVSIGMLADAGWATAAGLVLAAVAIGASILLVLWAVPVRRPVP